MNEEKLTTHEELLSSYRTTIVKTASGRAFEIEALSPGGFLLSVGSPLIQTLTTQGLNTETADKGAVENFVAGLTLEQQIALVSEEKFLTSVKRIVCAGVISINFVEKPQGDVDTATKEVSIDLLSMQELLSLYTAIINLSLPEAEVRDVQLFREESETVENGDTESASDSTDVRKETLGDSVPEQEKPKSNVGSR